MDFLNDKIETTLLALNNAVKGIDIKCTHSQFHDKVRELVLPLLENPLNMWTWEIQLQMKDDPVTYHDIFRYDRDIVKDKRSIHLARFSNVRFTTELPLDITGRQAIAILKLRRARVIFEEHVKRMNKLQAELAEAQDMHVELKNDVAMLEQQSAQTINNKTINDEPTTL